MERKYNKYERITKELYQRKKTYFDNRGLGVGDLNPTYNTYNPHFHVILAVNKTYFTDTKQYVSQDRWLELWREATGDASITQVSVKKVKANNQKEIMDLAKYGAKDEDYMGYRQQNR